MSEYNPDKWVVIKIDHPQHGILYKVFACWYGGWAGSDSWKLNSGITKVTETHEYFFFDGYSGSTYCCRKGCYGTNGYGSGVLNNLIEKMQSGSCLVEILPQETNFMELEYGSDARVE